MFENFLNKVNKSIRESEEYINFLEQRLKKTNSKDTAINIAFELERERGKILAYYNLIEFMSV